MIVDAPGSLVATAISDVRIDLVWSNADHYDNVKIYRKPSGGSYSLAHTTGYDVEAWSDTGRDPATTYYYYVKGVIDTDTSAASNIANATTFFDPPSSFTASQDGSHTVHMTWTNEAAYTSWQIYRKQYGGSYALLATIGSGDWTNYDDDTVLEGRKYYWKIRGKIGTTYSVYSNEDDVQVILPAPSNLAGHLNAGGTSATMTWQSNSVDETGFKVYKNGVLDATLGASVETYTATGLTPGTAYSFTVKACATLYNSAASNTLTLEALPGPTGLSGYSNAAGTEAVLSWNDNSPNEDSFKIYMDGALIYTTAANATGYTKTGLAPGSHHSFYVKAYAAGLGYSSKSNTLELTMDDPPSKPSGATAIATATTKVRLNWTDNADNETDFHIERSATSATAGFSEITTVGANVKTYEDTGRSSNTQYWYRVRAHNGSGYSAYSNVATAVTWAAIAAPTNLACGAAKVAGAYGVECTWDDNSSEEDAHCLERRVSGGSWGDYVTDKLTDGALETWTSATNLTNWTETLSGTSTVNRESTEKHGGTYSCKITIDASNSYALITSTALTLTAGGLYKISIWYKTAAGKTCGWRFYDTAANVYLTAAAAWQGSISNNLLAAATSWTNVTLEFTAHASYTSYTFQVGRITGADGTSSSYYFDDLSVKEFAVAAPLVSVAANQTYYHDATAVAGTSYDYRVRAKQNPSSYSGYSDEVTIAVPDVPAPPADLAISEYQDTWVRLAWTPTTGEVGYSIEQSDDAGETYTEVLRICEAGVSGIRIGGLTASTEHYWKIRAYNGAGYSSYSSPVSQTTRAAYLPSRFEKLIRKSKPRLLFLIEANPKIQITGWALTTGKTYTYEAAFGESGAELEGIQENGVDLVKKTSTATVEATAGTWWHDTATGKVYAHTLGGDDPINYTVIGSFWLYFSYGRIADVVYNEKAYLPMIAKEGLPDLDQEILPFYKGTLEVSSGEVSFINGKHQKAFYFDRRFARYLWLNRKVRVLAGGENFAYTEFKPIHTGTINSIPINDRNMKIELRDFRDGLKTDVPTARYSVADFPLMDTDFNGVERPYNFGAMTNELPACIDTTNKVFEYQHGRVKSVTATKNGSALTPGTDFYVDYQRGRLTLRRDLAWTFGTDVLLVSYSGNVNTADETIATGPEIFLHICRNYLGLGLADMDLDAIYATKLAKPTALAMPLRTATSTDEVFRKIEQSIQSYTMQDTEGRLGIRAEQTAPASGAPYIWDAQVFDFEAERTADRIFSGLDIYYAENRDGNYSLLQVPLPVMTWKHGVNKTLEIKTALATEADAAALGTAIKNKMERAPITFTVPRVLFLNLPGDVIPFNRNRFPSLAGTAANLPIRILGISKRISGGKTEIKAEVV